MVLGSAPSMSMLALIPSPILLDAGALAPIHFTNQAALTAAVAPLHRLQVLITRLAWPVSLQLLLFTLSSEI